MDKPQENDEFLNSCNKMLEELGEKYKQEKENIRKLMKLHKSTLKQAKKTGFTKPEKVPDALAKFVGLTKGTVMPRTDLTKKVYGIIKDRGLYYDKDGRVLRADKEIMELFNLTDQVNKSTNCKDENGLNFYNLQKYIAKCYEARVPAPTQQQLATV
jgi:chromatin remodeling complex protein RSC6